MSYSLRENATGGTAKSHLTGKSVSWVRDRAGINKRAALAELKQHDQQVREATQARATAAGINRPLTESEHRKGFEVDTRTVREKVTQDATHRTSSRGDESRNPHAQRIAELEAKLATAFQPKDRARLQKRLDIAHAESTKWEAKRAEKLAWEARMNSMPVKDALADAGAWLARLETSPTVPQSWVNDARKRLADLRLTGNTESYWEATFAFEKVREQVLGERAAAADAEALKHRAEAAEIRREKASDHPEPEPEPAATPELEPAV